MPDSFAQALEKSKQKPPSFTEALAAGDAFPLDEHPFREGQHVPSQAELAQVRETIYGPPVLSGVKQYEANQPGAFKTFVANVANEPIAAASDFGMSLGHALFHGFGSDEEDEDELTAEDHRMAREAPARAIGAQEWLDKANAYNPGAAVAGQVTGKTIAFLAGAKAVGGALPMAETALGKAGQAALTGGLTSAALDPEHAVEAGVSGAVGMGVLGGLDKPLKAFTAAMGGGRVAAAVRGLVEGGILTGMPHVQDGAIHGPDLANLEPNALAGLIVNSVLHRGASGRMEFNPKAAKALADAGVSPEAAAALVEPTLQAARAAGLAQRAQRALDPNLEARVRGVTEGRAKAQDAAAEAQHAEMERLDRGAQEAYERRSNEVFEQGQRDELAARVDAEYPAAEGSRTRLEAQEANVPTGTEMTTDPKRFQDMVAWTRRQITEYGMGLDRTSPPITDVIAGKFWVDLPTAADVLRTVSTTPGMFPDAYPIIASDLARVEGVEGARLPGRRQMRGMGGGDQGPEFPSSITRQPVEPPIGPADQGERGIYTPPGNRQRVRTTADFRTAMSEAEVPGYQPAPFEQRGPDVYGPSSNPEQPGEFAAALAAGYHSRIQAQAEALAGRAPRPIATIPAMGGGGPSMWLNPRHAVGVALSAADRFTLGAAQKIGRALGLADARTQTYGALRREIKGAKGGAERAGRQEGLDFQDDLSYTKDRQRLTPEQQDSVQEYLDTGQGRDALLASTDESVVKAADRAREKIASNEKRLVEAGILDPNTVSSREGGYTTRRFLSIEQGKEAGTPTSRGGINPGKQYRRQDLTPEQRAELGEIRDPGVRVAHTIARQESMIAALDAFETIASNPNLSAGKQRKGWVQLPKDTKRYGPLSEKWVRKDIAKDIEGFTASSEEGGLAGAAGRVADAYMNAWKGASTALNPATHVRNIAGNTVLQELDNFSFLDPATWKYIGKGLRTVFAGTDQARRDLRVEAIRGRIMNTDYVSTDVLSLMDRIAQKPGNSWKDKVGAYLKERGNAAKDLDIIRAVPGANEVAKLYSLEDTAIKMGSWMKKMDQGMSPQEAAKAVREAYPIHGEGIAKDLTKKAGAPGRLTVMPPFISFTEQAARILARAAIFKPVTSTVVATSILATLKAMGASDQEAASLVPSYMRPSMFRPAIKSDGKKDTTLDLTYVVPLANEAQSVIDTVKGEDTGQLPFGFSLPPAANAAIAKFFNKRTFPIKDIAPAKASQAEAESMKNKVATESLLPNNPFIPGSRPSNRIKEAAEGEEKDRAKLSKWFGVSLKDVDYDKALDLTLTNLVLRYRDLNSRIRTVAGDAKRTDADKKAEIANIQKEQKEAEEKMKTIRAVMSRRKGGQR